MQNQTNRRSFLKKGIIGSGLLLLGVETAKAMIEKVGQIDEAGIKNRNGIGFQQQPLPYPYNALEDCIDAMTMEIHYTKHAAAYTKNLNEAISAEKVPVEASIKAILSHISKYSVKMRNNAGGHYNHEMFWQCMRQKKENNFPTGKLADAITTRFGSFEDFKIQFREAAKNRFGSGWAWLYRDQNDQLQIGSTANQDNPLMRLKEIEHQGYPLLCLDVWEHAYYLKYQNKRLDYINNWWSLVNWDYVSERFEVL